MSWRSWPPSRSSRNGTAGRHKGIMESMTPESALPPVPLTVEGASVLHQMMRIRWSAWRALSATARMEVLDEAGRALTQMETPSDSRQSAVFSMLGHKADLMFVHFRRSFEELNLVERDLSLLRLADY